MRQEIPIFILCGGLGTRLKEETIYRPKPMVPIGDMPILWHIMSFYRAHGFKKFILCLGFKGEVIRDYFLNFSDRNSDLTLNLETNKKIIHEKHSVDWEVTFADTGQETMTGARIALAAKKYLGKADHFGVTYGDGLTNANLEDEWNFHLRAEKMGTVLGVSPPSRFGEFVLEGTLAKNFREKPHFEDRLINGGFFFFKKEALSYFSSQKECVLEQEALAKMTNDEELAVYRHTGFWACMDTHRDREALDLLWQSGNAPWSQYEMATSSN